jgi:hypothetical protein
MVNPLGLWMFSSSASSVPPPHAVKSPCCRAAQSPRYRLSGPHYPAHRVPKHYNMAQVSQRAVARAIQHHATLPTSLSRRPALRTAASMPDWQKVWGAHAVSRAPAPGRAAAPAAPPAGRCARGRARCRPWTRRRWCSWCSAGRAPTGCCPGPAAVNATAGGEYNSRCAGQLTGKMSKRQAHCDHEVLNSTAGLVVLVRAASC